MSFGESRPLQKQGVARGLQRTVGRVLRSLRQRLVAWRTAHRDAPEAASRDRDAGGVVPTETTPPPLPVFRERMIADPLSPSCPSCSLPLESWHGDAGAAGQPIGYEHRPCGTRTHWTPADVLKQMQCEVHHHHVHYWAQYREAIRQRERGAPRAGVGRHHGRGDER